ncbi:MAG TPA: carboxypeptidase-like regulatory domain-containing protein [Candidatus Limnocylindria bacterium]|nr:carboxypeptidase-like regulatory domain-containing protein [Candidatus Limnocylindria bacterium]
MCRTTLYRTICVAGYAALLVLWPPNARAQQVNVAQVSGRVTDGSGAAVPGVAIKLLETQRNIAHTATTDEQGRYVLPGLPVGSYQLEVKKEGFKSYSQTGIVLQVNDHVTLNAVLSVGSVSETVEVTAAASMIQAENASVSNVVESQRISELPLNGRYVTQLVLISGASMSAPGGDEVGSKNFYSSVTISVAGGQANGTNYLLDGGDNNDTFSNVNLPFPFPDALQEFSVETSSLPARNGLHPGGVVNLVTKSGTNSFHGAAFEFYRGGVLNAAPHSFLTASGAKRDNLLRNQFGGVVGGKIIRDKLFFFAGYQGTRQHSVATATTHTATAAALAGDFTALESPGCTGTTSGRTLKAPFSGNQANPTSFDPASVKVFSAGYVPLSTDPCGLLNYALPAIDNENQEIGRVDYAFSSKHNLYGRYFIDDFQAPPPFDIHNLILTQTPGNGERAQSLTIGDNYSISRNLVNSFHVTASRRRDNRGVNPGDINATTLGSNMYVEISNFLLTSISGYFGLGCGTCAPGHFNVNTWTEADDVDWIRGRHHSAFGALVIRTQNNTLTGYDENGTFTWNGTFTGDGLADFLIGRYSGFTQSRAQQVAYRSTIPSFYGQDTFRLSSRITLTAGLRWEPTLWPSDVFRRGSIFNMSAFQQNVHSAVYPNAPAGMLFFGDPGVPAAFTNNHLPNFAPRFGIAWDPTGNGKQSIRAGYGIFYDSAMAWYSQRLTSNPPVVNQIDNSSGCGTFSNPWLNYSRATGCGSSNANQNPFPGSGAIFPGGSFWVSFPPDMKPMYMQQWNLSWERQFYGDWAVSFSYLGNRSVHVPLSYDFNSPQVTPAACSAAPGGTCQGSAANETPRRFLTLTAGGASAPQNPGLIGILDLAFDSGFSTYHGLLASLKHRFRKGFSLHTNYTYSKCMSIGDFNGDLRGTYFQIQNNPRADYAVCNFDITHIFNATVVAASPFHGKGAVRWLLGGWQFAPAIRAQSGWPIDVRTGTDTSATGEGNDRPNIVPGQPIYINQWQPCNTTGTTQCYVVFNKAAFATFPSGTFGFGSVGRDFLRSPGTFSVDMAITRVFPIHDQKQIEFRFEAFNAINHFNPSIGGPGTTAGINSSNFGRQIGATTPGFVPSAFDPRILQLGFKMHW